MTFGSGWPGRSGCWTSGLFFSHVSLFLVLSDDGAYSCEMPDFLEVVFLGSGTSHGIPMIGCSCPVCRSEDPRDRRFRTSVAIRLLRDEDAPPSVIVIDTGPEFRLAAIEQNLERVDAVLFTHGHADHIMGLDDIRRYNAIVGDTIPCYCSQSTAESIRRCFGYAQRPFSGGDRPSITINVIDGPTRVLDIDIAPVPLLHDKDEIFGFRIGDFAYCTDCSEIPPTSMDMLRDLDVLVLDALRLRPHPGHFNLSQALDAAAMLKAGRTYFTHIAHELGHKEISSKLPPRVELAYDGLKIITSVPKSHIN
jgi:phosphoribosyl 1,2-cyclic phosphate phosphodiesterase